MESLLEPEMEEHLEPEVESDLEPQSHYNPWCVKNIQEFLYFCCPECDIKDQSQELFIKHALDHHPDSREYLINLQIKTEVFDDETYDNYEDSESFYYGEMVDCEIKEEINEQVKNLSSKKPKIKGSELKLLIKLVEQSGLNDVGKFCSQKRNVIWTKIAEDFNITTGHVKTVEQVRHKWNNYLHKKDSYSLLDVSEKRSNELQLLITLVEQNGLTEVGKFDSHRKVIWKKITEDFNQSMGLDRTVKQVRHKWNNYVHNKEKEFGKSSENISVKSEIKEELLDPSTGTFNNGDTSNPEKVTKKPRKKKLKEEQEIDLKFKCEVCGKGYGREFKLDLHKKKVHGIINISKCETCNKEFSSRCHLNYHVKSVHEKSLSVICDLCGNTFSNQTSLQRHHQNVHQKIKNYVCNFCSKAFSESKDLKMHIKCVHEGVKEHVCYTCGQAFGMRKSLNRHIKNIHDGIKDNICEFCFKAYSDKAKLNEHIKNFHERRRSHKCLICGKAYISPSKVKLHMKTSHPNVSLEPLQQV